MRAEHLNRRVQNVSGEDNFITSVMKRVVNVTGSMTWRSSCDQPGNFVTVFDESRQSGPSTGTTLSASTPSYISGPMLRAARFLNSS